LKCVRRRWYGRRCCASSTASTPATRIEIPEFWCSIARNDLCTSCQTPPNPGRRFCLERGNGRSNRQACVQDELALFSQRRVASSLQPGTAKRGAVTPWLGTITCWRMRGCNVRCTVAALAEACRVINRHNAKTERIEFAPIDQLPFLCEVQAAPPQSVARSVKLAAPWTLISPPGPACRNRPQKENLHDQAIAPPTW
jgi:hypothetical protein